MTTKGAVFFLAANSAGGFFSLFNSLYEPEDGWKAYIIKGGPGTGKSGLMRKVSSAAEEKGLTVEKIICSSDPDSLDAVIIPQKKLCFADGTAPHTIEPKYPGAVEEILNLGQFWDSDNLFENREHILTVTDCNKALHRRSLHYISAVRNALNNSYSLIQPSVSISKIENYAVRFVTKNCRCSERKGEDKRRFLSGITPKGYVTLYDTASELCDKIYTITDENFCIAPMLIHSLGRAAVSNGVDVISCLNPFDPDGAPLHIIFPEERIGFFTENSLQNFKKLSYKNISASRFVLDNTLSDHRQRLAFNRKIANNMLDEAVKLLQKAKQTHDKMESYYINAMDFNKLNEYTDNLISNLF